MTEKREFHAASVDEAVARAVRDLGIDQDDLSYRVVDEGNTGFLGIGVRDARIEVDAAAVSNKPALASEPAGPTPSNAPAEESSVEELEETSPPVEDVDEDDSEPNPIGATDASEDAEAEPVPRDALDETQERVSALLGAM